MAYKTWGRVLKEKLAKFGQTFSICFKSLAKPLLLLIIKSPYSGFVQLIRRRIRFARILAQVNICIFSFWRFEISRRVFGGLCVLYKNLQNGRSNVRISAAAALRLLSAQSAFFEPGTQFLRTKANRNTCVYYHLSTFPSVRSFLNYIPNFGWLIFILLSLNI